MLLGKGFNKEIYYKQIEKLKTEDYIRQVILKLREVTDQEEKLKAINAEAIVLLQKVSPFLLKYPDSLDMVTHGLKVENENDLYRVLKLEIDMLYMFALQHNYKTLEKAAKNYKKFRENPFQFTR